MTFHSNPSPARVLKILALSLVFSLSGSMVRAQSYYQRHPNQIGPPQVPYVYGPSGTNSVYYGRGSNNYPSGFTYGGNRFYRYPAPFYQPSPYQRYRFGLVPY